ncbi:MATE family efflux transporter [Blautia schinkii]|nr:MATE family efflux transporter [Blautia schinkii]
MIKKGRTLGKRMMGNQITEGVIWKQLLLFFFPIVFGTFFQQIYNTADTVVVGRFVGKEALAAVGGSASQIVNLIVGFFVGLASGATVIISQFYGAEDEKNLKRTMQTAFAFSIISSVVIGIGGIVLAKPMLVMMKTPSELMADSVLYLHIYFAGVLFNLIYNMGSGILRAVGDSKRPLYVLIITCILNIILDVLLVVAFHMGVAGVALATVISQAVSAVLVMWMLIDTTEIYRLRPKEIRLYKKPLAAVLRIGVPAGMESVMYNISNLLIQIFINALGTDTVAAWTTLGKIDAFYWMVINAFSIAITTFVGQNFGAGKFGRMRKSVRVCMLMSLASAIVISALLLITGKYIFRLFTTDASVITIGIRMLNFLLPAYSIYVVIGILSGALRGVGNVLVPMLLTCGGVCLLRIVWLFTVVPARPGINSIMASYPVSWSITAVLFILYYFRKFPKRVEDIQGKK